MPQSSFPSGEPQSERFEAIVVADEVGEEKPPWRFTALRSMKLWLRFAKAVDLEFITAAATAADESYPNVEGFLTGEDERVVAG